jgi:hypothetical protein
MNKIIENYVDLAIEHGKCTLDGNSKNGNQVHKKMMKLINEIERSDKIIKREFVELLQHENDSVKSWTAVTLLKTFENESISALSLVSKNSSIIGFTAQTTIDSWKKGLIQNIKKWEL